MTRPPDNHWNKLDWIQGDGPVAQVPSTGPTPTRPFNRVYPYRPRVKMLIFAIVFFGICGFFMSHMAINNDRGLLLEGIIRLSPDSACVFYWCVAACSFGFVAIALFFGLPQVFMRRQVVIDDSSITVPGWGFSTRHYRIEFRDMHRVSVSTYQRRSATYTTLKIHHIDGCNSINSNMLPHDHDIQAILEVLHGQVELQKESALVCSKCGYSLRGNISGSCPECGTKN